MLVSLVRLSLALELAAYAALGTWLYGRGGWSVAALVAASLVLVLGMRFALVSFTMLMGWLHGSPRPAEHRIGFARTVALVLGEYRALVLDNLVYLPWESLVMPRDPPLVPSPRVPVILVHGYFSNRGYFCSLARWLGERHPGPVYTPSFRAAFTPIERFAAELHEEIERIAAGTGQPKVILVCHSMGGLAARLYATQHGDARIEKLVTIASPHHGTALANLGVGANARQMRRGSGFLESLEAAEARMQRRFATTSIYSPHDNLVSPQQTSRLPWAQKNVALPGLGHVAILASRALFEKLLEELREARPPAG